MKKLQFCLLAHMVLFACAEVKPELIEVLPAETLDISLSVDTLEIATPETSREFPYRFPSFDYGRQVFAGLDERTNTINVYDLNTMAIRQSVVLHDQGPHAIQVPMVGSVWYQSPDSIMILQHVPNRLLMVNSKAEITWQRDLKEAFSANPKFNDLMAFAIFDIAMMYYQNGRFYFGLSRNSANQDFAHPLIGYYDIKLEEPGMLDIPYPEFYTGHESVGSYQIPGITWFGNTILVVYPYSPEIFLYDLDGNLKSHILKPDAFPMGKAPDPGQSARSHLLSNPLYQSVIPVQGGEYYVQYGQEKTPMVATSSDYQFTIIYNHDFSEYFVFDKNVRALSFGGDYFYYPMVPEQTDVQLLERYRIDE